MDGNSTRRVCETLRVFIGTFFAPKRLINDTENKENTMKKIFLTLALLGLAIAILGCSAAPAKTSSTAFYDSAPSGGAMPPVPAAAAPAERSTNQAQTGNTSPGVPNAQSAQRMIVYTVNLRLEVQDTEKAMNDLTAIAAQYKGYIAATNLARDSKNLMRGTVTLRIPAESLDAAQKQIEAAGLKVLNRNKNSNDVTDQYTDLNARLTNLNAYEAELRTLLATVREKSGKAEDILAVYNQLTQVRSQIEQIKGQMNVLEKTSTLATLTVELVPHEDIQVLEPDTWMPNQTAAQALKALVQALQALGSLLIWGILFFLPILIILALPSVVIVLILRAWTRRRAKKTPPPA
jgi:hypothetical protein